MTFTWRACVCKLASSLSAPSFGLHSFKDEVKEAECSVRGMATSRPSQPLAANRLVCHVTVQGPEQTIFSNRLASAAHSSTARVPATNCADGYPLHVMETR